MAKLYEKLQKALTSYEDRPISVITAQIFPESLYIVRGDDQGVPAWHFFLIPVTKAADLKAAEQSGASVAYTKFGRLVEYRNKRGEIKKMSGWGTDPPKMIDTWIDEQYDHASVDENVSLIYEKDDIRLCTMQRAIPKQLLGVRFFYYRQEQIHYIKLLEDLQSSLASRAGIKSYDRIISLNGINIKNYTCKTFLALFDSQRHLPVQMLVCSPATYIHYKSNNKPLYSDLPTVQRLKPVYATSTSDCNTDKPMAAINERSFCAVQWENSSLVSVMPQSAICKSPEFTNVDDICFVEIEEQYQKGKIICKGSYSECDKLKTGSIKRTYDAATNSTLDFTGFKSISSANMTRILPSENSCHIQTSVIDQNTNNDAMQYTEERGCNSLEQLPNELFFSFFTYLDTSNLYNAFWGLNSRINNLFQSYENLYLTFDEKTDQLSMKLYAPFVVRLIIDTQIDCDLAQFPNLQTLILCDGNPKHLDQIQPNILPNLTYLSFLLGAEFNPSFQLVNDIFSNKFPSLHHVNLGRVDALTSHSWSTSPTLCFISIRSNEPMIIEAILDSCPNLDHLQVHLLNTDRKNVTALPPSNHPLRRFTLWSHSLQLTLEDIDVILTYTPNVQYFYLQTVCRIPFIDLAIGLVNRLNHLSQFDCYVKEMINKNDRVDNLTAINQLHYCFSYVKSIEEDESFRIFATK